jgi:protein AroM
MMKVGTLTIGQTPRVDIIPEIQKVMGSTIEIVEKGALDGLDLEEVKRFYPCQDDFILVTRMKDGTEVKVAERYILERMKQCIADFQKEPVELILLLCTGEFPEIQSSKILLRLDRIMLQIVRGILERGKLGAIVPSPDQIPALRKRWEKIGLEVHVEAVSPYAGTDEQLKATANRIKALDVDLVILDCLGFGVRTKVLFKEITGKPVLLPRTLIAALAREMVEA